MLGPAVPRLRDPWALQQCLRFASSSPVLIVDVRAHLIYAGVGYLPFDHIVDLRPNQKLRIQTVLIKGSVSEAGSLVVNK